MAIPTILSGAAGRALRAFEPIATSEAVDMPHFAGWAAKQTINSAKPDLVKALGAARQPAFSAEMHAAITNLRNEVRVGASIRQIDGAMTELRDAARATALRRGAVALAVTGTVVGAGYLAANAAGGGSDPVPSAPGRPGDEPTHVSV